MLNKLIQNKVFKNFSYLTVGNGLAQVISLFTILRITHVLAPGDYGLFSFLVVQGGLLVAVGDLGIKNIVVRSIARDPSRATDLVANGAFLKTGALVIISSVYILYNHFFGTLTFEQLLLVFGFTFVNCLFNLFQDAFYGREKMLTPAIISLGYSICWFLSVYFLPASHFQVLNLFYFYLFLNILKAVFGFIFLKRQHLLIGQRKSFLASSKSLFYESWPYFILVLILLPMSQFAVNFLDINSTIDEVGYFNLSQKISGPVSLIIDLGLVSIFPNISALWIKDKQRFYQYVSKGFKYFMIGGLILCLFFTLFIKDFFTLIFPVSYFPAIRISQLQIWYIFLEAIDSLIGTIFGAINKEKLILKVVVVKALIGTPLLFWGSKYGALGLSYGFVISESLFQIYLWMVFIRVLKIKIKYSNFLWLLSLVVFLLSFYFLAVLPLIYRALFAVIIVLGLSFYFTKTYKLSKIL